jgi:hypothetical protein
MNHIIKAQLDLIGLELDLDRKKPRLLLSLPESAGDIFLSTSLLPSLKEAYPDYDIYYACNEQFFDILKNNPYIHKVIAFNKIMKDQVWMEGTSTWPGLFDISIFISGYTQVFSNYLNNGRTNIQLQLRKK